MAAPPRPLVWVTVTVGACLLAVAAGFLVDLSALVPRDRRLSVSEVEGTWTAASGSRLTVRSDGSAELENVPGPGEDCGTVMHTGPATWVFGTYPDESPGIRLDYPGAPAGGTCTVYLSIHVSEHRTTGFLPHNATYPYVRGTTPPG
ncbi:hypothetical protein ACFRJ1_35000 [Streptomyces sp. NPDC056773]|uniref:hypothetical protein n=1 Tax=unclassified Streptomyces TaxID=2593676 RepID=UPI0036800EEC